MAVSQQSLWAASPYLSRLALSLGEWWAGARESDPRLAMAELLQNLRASIGPDVSAEAIGNALRTYKQETALLLGTAEATGRITTAEATALLSDFADAALDGALAAQINAAIAKGDMRAGTTPATCGLAIMALGKQGGRELNYSSDIDIVAFFDPTAAAVVEGVEVGKTYTRIVQRLAAMMQDRAGDAYVFRTDLRLRPDPGSTPVALSIDAALSYYEGRGQNWERAAWIKARPCAGDKRVGEAFLKELTPYIWRKHLDLATITDIQAMKRQINVAKGVGLARVAGHNVKLGRGGIREIEFFVQTQQLIAGGRDAALRVRPTTAALAALAQAGWISERAASQLTQSYWFLRAVENRLQMLRDEQTHTMPETPEGIAVIAELMDFPEPAAFEAAYLDALTRVQGHYAELFTEGETLGAAGGNLVFTGTDDDPATLDTLAAMGFADPAHVSSTVRKWHYGGYRATRAAAARAQLTELLPSLLETIAETHGADEAFDRFDDFLRRLPSGLQLFSLLTNYAELRTLLIRLLASAPRMAEAVIHRAHVMDALIDPAFGDEVSRPAVLIAKVDAFLGEARDYQEVIDRARIIAQEQQFLVSAGLLSGTVTAQRAGEQFTALAETLLGTMFGAVRAEFERRHGTIQGARVGLLAFGKMASREMTANSDLDFIMLYRVGEVTESDGAKPLEASQYFARLTQRLVAALTAPTSEGVLYEVDLRLRPSGNAGPLATSFPSFVAYHEANAWTWEHLALSRARVVLADHGFGGDIEEAVASALGRARDAGKTVDDVIAMRELMAKERPARHPFDLKLQTGGLVDLEFIAQSAQLLARTRIARPQAATAAVLTQMARAGLLPEGDRLAEIHATYTTILQVMSAALLHPFDDEGWTPAFRDLLARLNDAPTFERLASDVVAMRKEVSAAAEGWYARAREL